MRRDCAPTWVDSEGRLRPLRRVRLGDREFTEDFLQATLHACPELLPLEDFDEEVGPLVSLGREVDCIDNLFVSPAGRLTLVETKLWRNPEATRTVVAQILEYATRVSHWSYEDLERNCRGALSPAPLSGQSLYELVKGRFPENAPTESEFHDSVQRTLQTGRFLLLVVGDGIREGLEDLLGSLHSHPRLFFTFGLVELQVFSDPESPAEKLIVPHVLANSLEIVRAVVRVESTGGLANVSVEIDDTREQDVESRRRHTLSEEEFFERITDKGKAEVVRLLLSRARELGAIVEPRAGSVSVRLMDPSGTKQKLTLFVVTTSAEIYTGWLSSQLETIGCDESIAADWIARLGRLIPGVERSAKDPDGLSRNIRITEIEPVLDEFIDNLGVVIEAIRESSGSPAD